MLDFYMDDRIALAESQSRIWKFCRIVIGVLLFAVTVAAIVGGMYGVLRGFHYAHGGESDPGSSFQVMVMGVGGVLSAFAVLLWIFMGSWSKRGGAFLILYPLAQSCAGLVLGHFFGGNFWSRHALDLWLGGCIGASVVLMAAACFLVYKNEVAQLQLFNKIFFT